MPPQILSRNTYSAKSLVYIFGLLLIQLITNKKLINYNLLQGVRLPGERNIYQELKRHPLINKLKNTIKDVVLTMLNSDQAHRPTLQKIYEKIHNIEKDQRKVPLYNAQLFQSQMIPMNFQNGLCTNDNINALSSSAFLKVLSIPNSLIDNSCGRKLFKIPTLKALDISGNNISDEFFIDQNNELLIKCQLTQLKVAFTDITNKTIRKLLIFQNSLQKLDFSYTKINTQGILLLRYFKKLQALKLWSGKQKIPSYQKFYSNFSGDNPRKYQHNKIEINKEGLLIIAEMNQQQWKLKQFAINVEQNITQILKNMSNNLIELQVKGIYDRKCLQIVFNSNKLMCLYLNNQNLHAKSFNSDKLKLVKLQNCKIFPQFFHQHNNITYLSLVQCEIFKQTIPLINDIRLMKDLQYLELSNMTIHGKELESIIKECKNIKVIISKNNNLNDLDINNLLNPEVQQINLKNSLLDQKAFDKTNFESMKVTFIHISAHSLPPEKKKQITQANIKLINDEILAEQKPKAQTITLRITPPKLNNDFKNNFKKSIEKLMNEKKINIQQQNMKKQKNITKYPPINKQFNFKKK